MTRRRQVKATRSCFGVVVAVGFQLPDAFDHGSENSLTDQRIEGVLDLIGGESYTQSIGNPPEHLRLPGVDRHGEVRVEASMLESMYRSGRVS